MIWCLPFLIIFGSGIYFAARDGDDWILSARVDALLLQDFPALESIILAVCVIVCLATFFYARKAAAIVDDISDTLDKFACNNRQLTMKN